MALPTHDEAPLLDAALRFADRVRAPFYSPGHKGGRTLPPEFTSRLAEIDLNNLPDTDTLHCPAGPILEAERLLADAYGVRQSFMLVGGSTTGNIAAILAACRPGDKMLVQRAAHKSTIAGLILAGAQPVWLPSDADAVFGIQHGVAASTLERALDDHPDAAGAIVLHPTYYGTTADIAALRDITARRGKLLIADAAHGAHFHFHPQLPAAAEDAAADLVVQSVHKVLSGLSQAAVLHRVTDRIGEARIRRALQLIQTTSPSFPIMASVDLARREMAREGRSIWDGVLQLARDARARLRALPGIRLLDPPEAAPDGAGFHSLDETKIVFGAPELGIDGPWWQRELFRAHGVQPELAGPDYLLCIMGVGSTGADVDRLVEAVSATIVARPSSGSNRRVDLARRAAALPAGPPATLSPRDAFFAACTTVPLADAAGRVAAEVVTPYPPGVPVLMPGERITPALVAFLLDLRAAGLPVSASDITLGHLLVIDHS